MKISMKRLRAMPLADLERLNGTTVTITKVVCGHLDRSTRRHARLIMRNVPALIQVDTAEEQARAEQASTQRVRGLIRGIMAPTGQGRA